MLRIFDLRAQVAGVAEKFGPETVPELVKRINEPGLTAEEAGLNPLFKYEWPGKWTGTVIELLGVLGLPGFDALWSLLDNPSDGIALRALIVLLRMPVNASGLEREQILLKLKQQLPKYYRKDVPLYPIISSMLTEARQEPSLWDVLSELSELVLLGEKKKKFVLGDMSREILHPPAPPPKPPELPEHKVFAEKFATALVNRDLEAVHQMLDPMLQKKKSPQTLEAEFTKESAHCSWPVRHEDPTFGGMRADELRGARSKYEPSLPKSIKDQDFLNWLWIKFLPEADSDSDFAFDLGVALVDSAGELKVGYYWATAED